MRSFGKVSVIFLAILCMAGCKSKTMQPVMNTVIFTVDTLVYPEAAGLAVVYEQDDFTEKTVFVENSSDDPFKWAFSWPDSLYERTKRMRLFYPSPSDTIIYRIYYELPGKESFFKLDQFIPDRGTSTVSLKFLRQVTEPDVLAMTAIGPRMTMWHRMEYLIDSTDDDGLLASADGSWTFGSFFDAEYEPGLERYAALSVKYPDSRFLMVRLADGAYANNFRSKDDLRKVYDNFSEDNKTAYWGSKVAHYLEGIRFENMELPAWDTQVPEPIITDYSKYNLVVFSASWCRPCHEMIPLLKEIYSETGDKLNLVYVSVDDEDGAWAWANTMREKEIPWRSVMALGQIDYMKNVYGFFDGIPAQFLVAPDGTMEKIDIRKPEWKDELYDTIGK